MQTSQLIEEMRAEASRLTKAANILDGVKSISSHVVRRGRHMSDAGKRRISIMMKKRWAERRREVKKKGGPLALVPTKRAA